MAPTAPVSRDLVLPMMSLMPVPTVPSTFFTSSVIWRGGGRVGAVGEQPRVQWRT